MLGLGIAYNDFSLYFPPTCVQTMCACLTSLICILSAFSHTEINCTSIGDLCNSEFAARLNLTILFLF